MSSSSSPNLVVELRRRWPRLLPAALLGVIALTVPLLTITASLSVRMACTSLAVALAIVAILQSGIGRPAAQVVSISWGSDGQWRLHFKSGEQINAILSLRSWLSPWVMCLKFTVDGGGARQIMLWRGELTPTAWQQWQLRLKLEAGQRADARFPEVAP